MNQPSEGLSRSMVFVLATAVGVIVANNYYAQPIISFIATTLGLKTEAAGLVVTLIQAGYGLGVLLLVPLGDMVESKRLSLFMISMTILGVLGLAFSETLLPYFFAALITGLGASTIQLLVPYAASLATPKNRGKVIGTLMSGLMIGIMLSRPAASFLTAMFSWHAVFVLSAVLMFIIMLLIKFFIPPKKVEPHNLKYTTLLKSMAHLWMTKEVLRRRAIYQACLFGAFCLFWTASPLFLAGVDFKFGQSAIALFALVGVSGAISAPFAGNAADKGQIKIASLIAMLLSCFSFIIGQLFPAGSTLSLISLVISAILLDAGITANLVLGQRAIFSLPDEYRSRLNGLYVATIFIGGGIGSALGAWAYAKGGWELTSWIGLMLPLIALFYFLTEKKSRNLYSFDEVK